jgi:hypothetical protein
MDEALLKLEILVLAQYTFILLLDSANMDMFF